MQVLTGSSAYLADAKVAGRGRTLHGPKRLMTLTKLWKSMSAIMCDDAAAISLRSSEDFPYTN